MLKRTKPAGFRAFCGVGLLALLLFAGATVGPSPASAASVSIVNGKTTSISKVPWQVAITAAQRRGQRSTPRARYFCGGSLITPRLVITAGHCVADIGRRAAKGIQVITGRTRLNNESQGIVTGVSRIIMPTGKDGRRLYRTNGGGASWDVALLRLASGVKGPTIKIAGADETDSWAPGQLVSTTGWGVTRSSNRQSSSVLRTTNQVMLPDRLCRRYNGRQFNPRTMNCMGGPAVNSTTCFGDSGGPLVATLGDEARLIGLTSFGDPYCSPYLPSVDSRVADDPMRAWVRRTALRISGIDVVGSGGTVSEPRTWCRIPRLDGLNLNRANRALVNRGCRVGRVVRVGGFSPGSSGRVIGSSFIQGWLAPLGTRVNLWLGR